MQYVATHAFFTASLSSTAAAMTKPLQKRDQRTPAVREDGVELANNKTQDLVRKRQNPTQAVRYIIRRQLVEQAKYVLRFCTQHAIGDGAEVECVKVSDPDVAAEENGVRGVQVDDLVDKGADVVGVCAAEPTGSTGGVDGDVLCVVEYDHAVFVGVCGAVERTEAEEVRRPIRTVGREELVEEGCSAVEQDGLGPKEEVRVRGFGVLVAIELVLCHNGLIVGIAVDDVSLEASVVGERGQLGEIGGVECMVVAEEEIGARQRCVSFEFLDIKSVQTSGHQKSGVRRTNVVSLQPAFSAKERTGY